MRKDIIPTEQETYCKAGAIKRQSRVLYGSLKYVFIPVMLFPSDVS